MNPLRYKLMVSYLPGMAAIVNSFQSPDVQKAVFDSLMEALNAKMEAESTGAGTGALARNRVSSAASKLNGHASIPLRESARFVPGDEIAHDLAEGDSIHSMAEHQETLS